MEGTGRVEEMWRSATSAEVSRRGTEGVWREDQVAERKNGGGR